jgi:ferredoxin-NADP reductase
VVHVLSDDQAWPGEKGRVDRDRIARLVPDVRGRDVFLCGPPPMARLVRAALRDLGLPRSQVHFERFSL